MAKTTDANRKRKRIEQLLQQRLILETKKARIETGLKVIADELATLQP